MKKVLSILLIFILQQQIGLAQDFVLNNPVISPAPGMFPGGKETITFDFYVAGTGFTFSSSDLSNNYATITFSFTKLNPTATPPSGTGALLFNWVLTNNGGVGVNRVYTWTGTSKDIVMLQSPPAPKYKITFSNVPITLAASQAESDVRVAGQFTDPGNAPTGSTVNNSAFIATYTSVGAALPIRLLTFNGQKDGNSSLLNWETSKEENSNYFDVEHSIDGVSWSPIGRVNAAKNSNNARQYHLRHANPVNGANYYRLKMVDADANFTYSNVAVINFSLKGIHITNVYPNPFVSSVQVSYFSESTSQAIIEMFNSDGKLVLSQKNSIQAGSGMIMINGLQKLAQGSYLLKATIGNAVYTEKLIK